MVFSKAKINSPCWCRCIFAVFVYLVDETKLLNLESMFLLHTTETQPSVFITIFGSAGEAVQEPRGVSCYGPLYRLLLLYYTMCLLYRFLSRMPPRHGAAKYSVEKNVRPYCTPVIDLDPHTRGFMYLEPLHSIHHDALSYDMQYSHIPLRLFDSERQAP